MSTRLLRLGAGIVLSLALAGCGLPRGAGFESEVLGSRPGAQDPAARDFAVEPVTRERLARYAAWPAPAAPTLGWLARQDGPANRIIAPGDVLSITLWSTEENSLLTAPGERAINMRAVTVSSTGTVFMPYVGDIKVSGMSPDRAREVIEGRFVEVSPSAQVQLEVAEPRGSLVSLVGGVSKPGTYPLPNQAYSVLSLIAEGGGVPDDLNNPQIRLIRGDSIYGTSVERLFANPSLDATLRPGDKVLVQEDDRYFLSLGATGDEAVNPFPKDRLSAIEALSLVGGVSDNRANPKGILVLRTYPASAVRTDGSGPSKERVVFTLDLTSADGLFSAGQFEIQSGDLVYGTESPIGSAQTIFSILGSGLGVFTTAGLINNE
ncbi:polysaccharide biosynthesis/export family protein [Rubellimicrobium aerolatum]|uniref:Polysaccharide biosynthesis/export family protein n=1 Tax=Rubellimicrobium aerolatum TaxID=490979 RepID=A0ABW0S9A6_9RHOB|nr:polysaccharide biosynthesis/export family protein [Rubellimicrobium aerolatum]MBP1804888.1 polysaccharide export outer membrane protein [Rubellimicrobium aerolatum]